MKIWLIILGIAIPLAYWHARYQKKQGYNFGQTFILTIVMLLGIVALFAGLLG